jgi:CHAD domain-containing protein
LAIERRRRHEATQALLADTNVQSMMQQFDAQLKEHTVKSLSPEEFE